LRSVSTFANALRGTLNRTDHPMLGVPDYHSGGECSKHALAHPQSGMEDVATSRTCLWKVGMIMVHLGIGVGPGDNRYYCSQIVFLLNCQLKNQKDVARDDWRDPL
jgi:hypothetical protein